MVNEKPRLNKGLSGIWAIEYKLLRGWLNALLAFRSMQ
jgi:hypothetical protein